MFTGQRRSFVLRVPALELRWHLNPGAHVGVQYSVAIRAHRVTSGMLAVRMTADGWVSVPLHFTAAPTHDYTVTVKLEDIHGFRVTRTLNLQGASAAATPRAAISALARPTR